MIPFSLMSKSIKIESELSVCLIYLIIFYLFFKFYFIFKLYNIVLVLPQVYLCFPS